MVLFTVELSIGTGRTAIGQLGKAQRLYHALEVTASFRAGKLYHAPGGYSNVC